MDADPDRRRSDTLNGIDGVCLFLGEFAGELSRPPETQQGQSCKIQDLFFLRR